MRETMSSSICHMLMSLLLFVFLQHTLAIKQSHIVYLGSHSFGSNPSLLDSESVTNSHYDLLGSYLGSTEKAKEAIFYSYNKYINGFAAILEEDEATEIAKHSNVVSMFLNKRYELHTTRSWNFLGLESDGGFPNDSIWKKSLGEDIIIGNLDSGVWPESKSFSDEGYGPIPKKWKGICQVAEGNPDKFYCNRKLIGAKYFYKGYQADPRATNVTFNSARNLDGHGTHTLSTAGGNFVEGANILGFGNGTASGGSPKARVATYKVCWEGCSEADILAGFEAAIGDGVDVLSVSLGGNYPQQFFSSGVSIGSFHAIANNITVVASGGNSGPDTAPVVNVEPWTLTVAASTIDRDFTSYVILGNNKTYKGASLSELNLPPNKLYPLISGLDAMVDKKPYMIDQSMHCEEGSLDPKKVKGKILVCLRGVTDRVDKGVQVFRLGAIGMILINYDQGYEVIADPHVLPATHVAEKYGTFISNYIIETKSPVASITKVETQLGIKNAPMMASFSSRGPNIIDRSILKPDITAPGVNIVAAYSLATSPTNQPSDKRRIPFAPASGTSMSCPHVAGLVGLIKSIHPDWSPAAIKSAIMTTATTKTNNGVDIMDSSLEKATPFEYGAGHVQPNLAVDPGLVYDLNVTDYLNYLCGSGYTSDKLKVFYKKPYTCPKSFSLADFNYPSITVPEFKAGQSLSVTRTVTNVGSPSEYIVEIQEPPQFLVIVQPKILRFTQTGEKREFKVTFTKKPGNGFLTYHVFGKLIWTNGKHRVGTPITISFQD